MDGIDRKLFINLRYIVAVVALVTILLSKNVTESSAPLLIIYFLIYAINLQLRIFLNFRKLNLMVSIIFDLVIGFLIYKSYGGPIILYYSISIIDAAIILTSIYSYVSLALINGFIVYIGLSNYPGNDKIQTIIFNVLMALILAVLGRYIKYQNSGKIEAHMLYDELRKSEDELQAAYKRLEQYSNTVEEITILRERNRISREIHDTVGHTLTTIIIELQALPYIMKVDEEKTKDMLSSMISFSKAGLEDVRRAVKDLKPTEFDEYAGIFAIKELVAKFIKVSNCDVLLTVSKNQLPLNPDQAFTLYRVVQESLNNALRHGNASEVEIFINFGEDKIFVRIKDNGIGTSDFVPGFGISNMEERIRKLKGSLNVYTEYQKGFEINISIPK